ncbi:L-lactate MFS transporter [Alkalicoccobacillus murimartini]|uniref:OFA family oxalate/formate antiporter-like MFS transporter n=1 Tax=Alkalicoccobacillus murimartini TaxID=171685 RepID=A0ABT9YGS6_9BACI|nr:OFA family MFS transporter [Alkalicoccobacillus murimartini]MDQ0206891.1 OFA family oxalate/formate antiporter-like MFS transporter [Alkalicoccobacillus murimartini]
MNTTKTNRLWIVFGTVLVQMGLGTIYTWSLFNQPLAELNGWNLNAVTVTFSITSFALAFATLFSGKIQEWIGIRKLLVFSGIALGIGLMLSSFVTSLWMLYLLAGAVVGFANGTAYMSSLSNLIKWFPERKGLISGISVGAFGTGSLLFRYINGYFLSSFGVTQTFLLWGISALVLIAGGALLVREAKVSATVETNQQLKDYNVKEMLRTKQAYMLFVIFFTACMSGLYLIGIVKDAGETLAGLDAQTAANAVALVAIFNTTGRVVLGALSDKMERMHIIAATLFATALAVAVLSFAELNFGLFFACVAIIAFSFGGNITIFPAIVSDYFGMKNQSRNYGVIYQGFGFGALAGSIIFTIMGGFVPTFMVIAAMCIISFILAVLIRNPRLKALEVKEKEEKHAGHVAMDN